MTQTFVVENIKCGGCMNTIKTALMKIGATSVDVNETLDTIAIESELERDIFVQKLNDLGYPEMGNNTLGKKAMSFVSCAVGRVKGDS